MNKKLMTILGLVSAVSAGLIYSGLKDRSRIRLRNDYSLIVNFMDYDGHFKFIEFGIDFEINDKKFDLVVLKSSANLDPEVSKDGNYSVDLVNSVLYGLRSLTCESLLDERAIKVKLNEISISLKRDFKFGSLRK